MLDTPLGHKAEVLRLIIDQVSGRSVCTSKYLGVCASLPVWLLKNSMRQQQQEVQPAEVSRIFTLSNFHVELN